MILKLFYNNSPSRKYGKFNKKFFKNENIDKTIDYIQTLNSFYKNFSEILFKFTFSRQTNNE